MKLKYYLRGMGIGIILTAIVMGFALGGRKATLSDAEIIQRAKALGMKEADSGVLAEYTEQGEKTDEQALPSSSDQTLDETGKEISEENDSAVAETGKSVSEMASKEEEGEAQKQEDNRSSEQTVTQTSKQEPVNDELTTEVATADDIKKDDSDSKDNQQVNSSDAEETAKNEAEENKDSKAENTKPDEITDTAGAYSGTRSVTISGGQSSDAVAAMLEREGIVDNAVSFNRYLIDRRIDRIIRSGTKVIPEGSTYEQVANIITK